MRTEASLDQWGELYAVATRIKDLKPWEFLWDMDLIGVQTGNRKRLCFSALWEKVEVATVSMYTKDTRD